MCEAALISLFWTSSRLKALPQKCFEFPFNLIGKLTMDFLTGQSWHILKSSYTGRGPGQGFWCCFADGLNQKLTSISGAGYDKLRSFLSKLAAGYSPGYLLFGYFSSLVTFFSLFLLSCKLLCCYHWGWAGSERGGCSANIITNMIYVSDFWLMLKRTHKQITKSTYTNNESK